MITGKEFYCIKMFFMRNLQNYDFVFTRATATAHDSVNMYIWPGTNQLQLHASLYCIVIVVVVLKVVFVIYLLL